MDDSTGEKQFAPTERRLQQAREKGQVPVGRDLLTAAAYVGLTLAVFNLSGTAAEFTQTLKAFIENAPLTSTEPADFFAQVTVLPIAAMKATFFVFVLPALAVIAALLAQKGLVFSTSRLEPKLSKISPIAGAKKKFGLNGMVEFLKSTTKLVLTGIVLGVYLSKKADVIVTSSALDPVLIPQLMAELIGGLLILLCLMQIIVGSLDYLWQKFDHIRQLRMSRKELTDDMKQSEGDPHIKSQRRRRAEEIAMNKMMSEVQEASVIIVNPTHYAVALKWSRSSPGAPICVAKGVDETAARIRQRAIEHNIPIRHDPPVARALYATVRIGEQIQPQHYRAVAAAIRFAENMRQRAKKVRRDMNEQEPQ